MAEMPRIVVGADRRPAAWKPRRSRAAVAIVARGWLATVAGRRARGEPTGGCPTTWRGCEARRSCSSRGMEMAGQTKADILLRGLAMPRLVGVAGRGPRAADRRRLVPLSGQFIDALSRDVFSEGDGVRSPVCLELAVVLLCATICASTTIRHGLFVVAGLRQPLFV